MVSWHTLSGEEISRRLAVDFCSGLKEEEAAARLRATGPNCASVRPGRGPFRRFLSQLIQPLILALLFAGVATLFLREWVDASVILGVVLVNAIFGFIQEGKAEAALAALARAVTAEATVLRDGMRRRLDSVALVPGDIVILSAADKVPADLRLFAG